MILRWVGRGLVALMICLANVWAVLAFWIDGPTSEAARTALAMLLPLASIAALLLLRPLRRAVLAIAVTFIGVVAWWTSIAPSNDRDWQADVAQLPTAEIVGDRLTVHNVRNFEYRSETDFTPRYEDRVYDLSKLTGVDLYLCFWGPTMIAHTITAWEFSEGPPLAISIETRKEKGEEYSALRGFFRQYELTYVLADERDVVGLRTNHRGETVYLYQLRTPPERARAVLLDYLESVNELARRPEFYNALTDNCTTNIRTHFYNIRPGPRSWKILANGFLDELLYETGAVNTSLPFDEFKRSCDITERAKAAGDGADFSQRVREGLPNRTDS